MGLTLALQDLDHLWTTQWNVSTESGHMSENGNFPSFISIDLIKKPNISIFVRELEGWFVSNF